MTASNQKNDKSIGVAVAIGFNRCDWDMVSRVKSCMSSSLQDLRVSYLKNTPQTLKLIDAYLVFVMMTGVIQFAYVILAGQYPYNAFLASFCTSVGSFVLAANLRIQLNPFNDVQISPQRAFADFCFASLVLFGFAINFVG